MEENPGTSPIIWRKIQGPVQPYGGNSRDQSNHTDKNPGISPASSSVSLVSIAKEWHKENDLKAIYVEFL
jgi:hypothetical protein